MSESEELKLLGKFVLDNGTKAKHELVIELSEMQIEHLKEQRLNSALMNGIVIGVALSLTAILLLIKYN